MADRWDHLFQSLETELEGVKAWERVETVRQVSAAETRGFLLLQRLRASLGERILVYCADGKIEEGVLSSAHSEWIELTTKETSLLLQMSAVSAFGGLRSRVAVGDAASTSNREEPHAEARGNGERQDQAQDARTRMARIIGATGQNEVQWAARVADLAANRTAVTVSTPHRTFEGFVERAGRDHFDVLQAQSRSGLERANANSGVDWKRITVRSSAVQMIRVPRHAQYL